MNSKQFELNFTSPPIHPYQVIDTEALEYEEPLGAALVRPVDVCTSNKSEISAPAPAHHYLLPSGNPYAGVNEVFSEQVDVNYGPKTAFIREATRIFRQYSPTTGIRRLLRPEFREFVTKQAEKGKAHRIRIINELRKFDLESDGLASPLFNREMSDRVLKKLNKIAEE